MEAGLSPLSCGVSRHRERALCFPPKCYLATGADAGPRRNQVPKGGCRGSAFALVPGLSPQGPGKQPDWRPAEGSFHTRFPPRTRLREPGPETRGRRQSFPFASPSPAWVLGQLLIPHSLSSGNCPQGSSCPVGRTSDQWSHTAGLCVTCDPGTVSREGKQGPSITLWQPPLVWVQGQWSYHRTHGEVCISHACLLFHGSQNRDNRMFKWVSLCSCKDVAFVKTAVC